MAICKFFQAGHCRNGNRCTFEHIKPSTAAASKYNETSIKTNLTEERPQWKLSVYGPAKEEPNLIVGTDKSCEEDRLLYYMSMRAVGNESQYLASHEQSFTQMENQVNAILSNATGAIQHYEKQKSNHSGPFGGPANNAPFAPFTAPTNTFGGGNAYGQQSTSAFGAAKPATAFGQPSAFGTAAAAPVSAFGQPSAFGSTSALGGGSGSAFGSTSALGSGGSAFGSKSTLGGGSAFGSTSALGGGGSAFGSTSALGGGGSAFGSTSALGGSGSAFGSTNALGSGSAFGSTSALGSGTSAFGQPSAFGAMATTTPASAFGSTSTPSAFGATSTPSAFGTTSTPSAFGATNTPSAFGTTSTPSAFGNTSTLGGGGGGGAFGNTAFGANGTTNNVPGTMQTGSEVNTDSPEWKAFAASEFTYLAIPEIEPPIQLR